MCVGECWLMECPWPPVGVAQEVGAVLDVTGVNLSDSVHTT